MHLNTDAGHRGQLLVITGEGQRVAAGMRNLRLVGLNENGVLNALFEHVPEELVRKFFQVQRG